MRLIHVKEQYGFHLPGSDRIRIFKVSELEMCPKKGYYELAVAGTREKTKFLDIRRGYSCRTGKVFWHMLNRG